MSCVCAQGGPTCLSVSCVFCVGRLDGPSACQFRVCFVFVCIKGPECLAVLCGCCVCAHWVQRAASFSVRMCVC